MSLNRTYFHFPGHSNGIDWPWILEHRSPVSCCYQRHLSCICARVTMHHWHIVGSVCSILNPLAVEKTWPSQVVLYWLWLHPDRTSQKEMQAFTEFRQYIRDLFDSNSCADKSVIVRQLEHEAFQLCLSFDTKIQSLNDNLQSLNGTLHKKDNDLIRTMDERFNLAQELTATKESARSVIKCLNISLKSSSHIVARTIIEMISRDHLHSIDKTIERRMEQFRRERGHSVSDNSRFCCHS